MGARRFLKFIRLAIPLLGLVCGIARAHNPIIPDRGVTDPHIHIFNGRAYLYATHDRSPGNQKFAMDDWWCWSSDDLVNWKLESVLKPEQTYLGRPFDECWATDAAQRNGKYYWYFSEYNQRTGVVVGDSPSGPWRDPLKKPLLESGLTTTDEYDPTIFCDDDGQNYIVFGVGDYYIARLNEDMISLAEKPRELVRLDESGNKKYVHDDKNYLHKYHGNYYLSWGCSYAMSTNLYGPYYFKRTLFRVQNFEPGFDKPTWPAGVQQGRHGNFFEWHNQWYFCCCDMSHTGNRRYRDSIISYVHYRANGEIADIKVDGIGVGEYEVKRGRIEAENYFVATNVTQVETPGGFGVTPTKPGGFLLYPNVHGLTNCMQMTLEFSSIASPGQIEIREGDSSGFLLAECKLNSQSETNAAVTVKFAHAPATENLCLKFGGAPSAVLDAFTLSP